MTIKYIILLLAFITFNLPIKAFIDLDSIAIYQKLADSKDNVVRINSFLNLSELYEEVSTKKSLEFANKAFVLSNQIQDSKLKAICYYKLANIQSWLGDLSAANTYADKVYEYAKSMKDDELLAKYYLLKAHMDILVFKYSSSLKFITQAKEIGESINSQDIINLSIFQISYLYLNLKDYETAIKYLKTSYIYFKSMKNQNEYFRNIFQMATAYIFKKEYDSASTIIDVTLKLIPEKNLYYKAYFIKLKGLNYYDGGKVDSALIYLGLSSQLATKLNFNELLGLNYTVLGHIHEKKNELLIGKEYNAKALYHRKLLGFKRYISSSFINLANSYSLENNYLKSLQYLDSGLVYALDCQQLHYTSKVYNQYYKIYKNIGKNDSALKYLTLYLQYKDSIYKSENRVELFEYQAKIEISNSNNIIKKIGFEKSRTTSIFLIICLSLLMIIIIIVYLRMIQKRKHNLLLTEQNVILDSALVDLSNSHNDLVLINLHLENTIEEQTCDLKSEVISRRIAQEKLQQARDEISVAYNNEKNINNIKSRLINLISHEYRTPMTVILASAEMIKTIGVEIEQSKFIHMISKVIDSVSQMISMIDDVLILGLGNQGEVELKNETLDIIKFIENSLDDIKNIDKGVHTLIFNHNIDELFVNFDKKALWYIFSNILTNAIKYSLEKDEIVINCYNFKHFFTIEVIDHGIGIPESELTKIFDPFYRGSNVGKIKGTGFGLSIVKSFVERMNGKLSITSKINLGTMLKVTLPIVRPNQSEILS